MNIYITGKNWVLEDWLATEVVGEDQLYIQHFIKKWLVGEEVFSLFTSGSTGKPKEIWIQRSQMEHSARLTCAFFGLQISDRVFLTLNPKVVGGTMMIVRALVAQMDLVVVSPSANPFEDRLIPLPSFTSMVPMQLQKVLEIGAPATLKTLRNHRAILLGGGPVSKVLEEQVKALSLPVWLGYGMTETVSHIALRRLDASTQVFHPMDGVALKLDERSCLAVKSVVTLDTWIQTNDVVALSAEGFVWKGRADFTINTGGVKVQIEAIEQKLAGYVQGSIMTELLIFSMKDDRLGEQVCCVCFVEQAISLEKVALDIRSLLSKYEYPRKYFYRQRSVPRTLSGKVDRREALSLLGELPADQKYQV